MNRRKIINGIQTYYNILLTVVVIISNVFFFVFVRRGVVVIPTLCGCNIIQISLFGKKSRFKNISSLCHSNITYFCNMYCGAVERVIMTQGGTA